MTEDMRNVVLHVALLTMLFPCKSDIVRNAVSARKSAINAKGPMDLFPLLSNWTVSEGNLILQTIHYVTEEFNQAFIHLNRKTYLLWVMIHFFSTLMSDVDPTKRQDVLGLIASRWNVLILWSI